MKFGVVCGSLTEQPSDVVIVNLFQGVKTPGGATGAVDKALGGAISAVIADDEFEGKLGEMSVIRVSGGIPSKKVLLVGLGKSEEFSVPKVMRVSASAARRCRELKAKSVASILHGAGIAGLPAYECAKAVVEGAILGAYEYTRLKTENVKENHIESFTIVEMDAGKVNDIEKGINLGETFGSAITWARDLINEPSNIVNPPYLAKLAEELASEYGLQSRVLDRNGIENEGMGLIAAVSRGSDIEPRFIELKYTAEGASKTVAIVGKGVTFDAGGYSLKPADSMYGMKDDMAGAAAVLATMKAVCKLKPKVNVTMLIPAVENLIGARAIHPGDIFKSYDGKTVEINNTDAEGRLILADTLSYAKKQGVDEIIDLATLTGACVVALGHRVSAVFSTNNELANGLINAATENAEHLWRLPLHDEYKEQLKSDVADLKNTGGRWGGAITGALFLGEFVGNTPWAHIDLSSVLAEKDIDISKKGPTGAGVATLIEYLQKVKG